MPANAPTEQTKRFAKTLSLAELQIQIIAFENGLGAVKALGRTAEKTAATFTLGDPPAVPVKLVPGSRAPSGYDLVCSGGVWILSQPQTISAVRRRAEDRDEAGEDARVETDDLNDDENEDSGRGEGEEPGGGGTAGDLTDEDDAGGR